MFVVPWPHHRAAGQGTLDNYGTNPTHEPTENRRGRGQRKTNPDRWYLKDGGKADSAHHVIRLDFNPDDMRVRFILMDGSAWDDHTIKARNH